MKIAYLDGPRLRRSFLAASRYVRGRRAELNRINVFPVPDGDTGSNLAMTIQAVADRLQALHDRSVSVVAYQAAEAAVLGARGNCGMMLSQVLLGFAEDLSGRTRAGADEVARAIRAGSARLQSAIERPVEGTILTVVRDTADAGGRIQDPDLAAFVARLVDEARASLERTPDLLPVLREAGVVDAGAKGFVALLEGFHGYITGDAEDSDWSDEDPGVGVPEGPTAAALVDIDTEESPFRYCTEALVRADDLPSEVAVRDRLRDLGDSLVVIRTGDALKVHIHTDEPDRVFEILGAEGRIASRKAEDLHAQHEALARAGATGLARRPIGVVTDSASDLPEEIVRAHGIRIVPLDLISGDECFKDRFDISAEEFAHRMMQDGVSFSTSQPSPGEFARVYADAAEDAEELVVVTLGSGLSGTFRSAENAGRLFIGAPTHFMDSQGASLLTGLLALKAAELGESGMGGAEIVQELERIRDRSGVYITVDRYDRLLASGRVGKGMALVGATLSVKPILSVARDGNVVRSGQAIGRKRVLQAVLRAVTEQIPSDVKNVRFGIVHVGCPERLDDVGSEVRARWPGSDILTAHATPVLANHVGLGAWGLAYMVED